MNVFDIILLAFLLLGFIRGFWSGFFVCLSSFVSMLVGIFIAMKFSSFTSDILRNTFFKDWKHLEIIAFVITFIAVVIGITLLAKVFTKMADFSGLGLMNKILGGVFGLLKTVLILSVLLLFFEKVNQNN